MVRTKLLASTATLGGLAMTTALSLGLTVAAPTPARAGVCSAITDTSGPGATDCNVLLTINADGSETTTFPYGTPYDGSDDNYIGILNNSSLTLSSFAITGPLVPVYGGIFGGMDGDGICDTIRFSSVGFACTGLGVTTGPGVSGKSSASLDYAPDGVTLDALTTNSGTVTFAAGLATGQLGVFSLEEPATTGGITITENIPEPASLTLIGSALAALGFLRRRKKS